MHDVFLSYARAENKTLAGELYLRLRAAGLSVWWDLECMPSRSLTFLQEIRLAVRDAARTVVLVDGPATRSEYVRAEWQYALAAGKPVVPLLRLDDYDALPPEFAGLHSPDFRASRPLDAAVEELLRVLSNPPAALGRLLGDVPEVPPHYRPRVDANSRLARDVMLGRNEAVTVISRQRITLLHGMGGSGKSVVAAALARSTAARQAFADGIAWLAPDADTSPEALLRALGDLLGGITRNWHTRAKCVDGVRELLSERRVLLVVDNASTVGVIEPLIDALDVDSRVLVTTRLPGLAADLGARAQRLGDLEPPEAIKLLADWAGSDPEALPPIAAEVAKRCGYLAFALAINGAMVRRGTPWSDLLEALQEHKLEFAKAHERLAHYRYRNVFHAIRPSLVELARNEPQAARWFAELPAFHWAEGVPEAAVTRFWVARGCRSAGEARVVLTDLADRSLLRLDGEAPARRIRLHDIQLDYLIATGADTKALGRALLDSYGAQPDVDWPLVAPDGYFHQHALRHLIELGDTTTLQRLLDHTREGGGNAWFEAAEAADNLDGYLGDLDRATAAWPRQGGDGLRGPVPAAVHQSLIRASITSMSSALSPEIRKAMLRTSLWSSRRALAEARQVADPDRRVHALLEAAPLLDDADRKSALTEALDLARTRGNQVRASHLVDAACLLVADERAALLEEARAVARTIESAGYRASALAKIAGAWDPATRGPVVEESLDAAAMEVATAGVGQGGFDALPVLAPLVPAASLPRLLDLVRAIPNDFGRAMAFAQVVPHVADPSERARLAEEGAKVEETVEGNSAWIQIALAVNRADCDVEALFDEVARGDRRQIDYLVRLLPPMSPQEAERWLARLRAVPFDSERDRFDALFEISNRLGDAARERLVDELATLAQRLPYDSWRSRAYDALAHALDARQLTAALRVLRTIGDERAIGDGLSRLLPELDAPLRAAAADFVRSRVDGSQSLDVLVASAAAVDGDLREALLGHALAAWRAGASFGGGTYSPQLATDTLLRLARMAGMPERIELLQHVVDSALGGPAGAESGAEAVAAAADMLAPEFVDRCAEHLARRALDDTLHGTVQTIHGTRTGRPEVLASTFHVLAPLLTPVRATAFLDLTDAVPDSTWRMAARAAVVARLPEPQRSRTLSELVTAAAQLSLGTEDPAANPWRPLVWLAQALPERERGAIGRLALEAARAVGSSWRATALAGVLEVIDGPPRETAVEEALALDDKYSVPPLVKYLPRERAWTIASRAVADTINWQAWPADQLSGLLSTGEPSASEALWLELSANMRSLTRAELCERYAALAPLLRKVGGPGVIPEFARSVLATAGWWK